MITKANQDSGFILNEKQNTKYKSHAVQCFRISDLLFPLTIPINIHIRESTYSFANAFNLHWYEPNDDVLKALQKGPMTGSEGTGLKK